MKSTLENTHIVWLSFSAKEKNQFLAKNLKPKLETALDATDAIPEKGGTCMVCIVEALECNPNALQNELKLKQIINGSVGKTWNKPSKQKKHNTTNKHELPFFCKTKADVAKALRLWRLGLSPIGGHYCSC